jgi:hypothetical protein
MTDTEIQNSAANVAFRGTAMIHSIALELDARGSEPGSFTDEQRDKQAAAIRALHAAHEALGHLAQSLHPGEFKQV